MPVRCFMLAALAAVGCLFWAATQTGRAEPDKELKRAIEKSVDRAVAFLKKNQARDGFWYHANAAHTGGGTPLEQNVGATALCGLALIESGVDIDDSAIQKAASVVRGHASKLTYTYAIASALIFLERVGKSDSSVVAMLGQKLVQGQRLRAWSYYCPAMNTEDNSNTQFAILALWIARRHGVKGDRALQLTEQNFREHQETNTGGWAYQFTGGPTGVPTPSMTCAGLLALAFGHGTKHKPETEFKGASPKDEGSDAPEKRQRPRADLKADPQVIKAKDYLAQVMQNPNHDSTHTVYFLWTLERVCMIYGYSQFGNVDWYNWGAHILLRAQTASGGWSNDPQSGANCETAWALLFLRKSNLAADLDIGEATLSGGTMKDVGRNKGVRPPPKQVKAEQGRVGKPGEAVALKEELRTAILAERIEEILDLMEKTKNGEGGDYTMALAEIIPMVRPAFQGQVRRALANRVGRMRASTLKQYLAVENKELRLAAVAAIEAKDEKDLIPDLIPLLAERDPLLIDATVAALKKLSGKDHGRDQAAWQRWLDSSGK